MELTEAILFAQVCVPYSQRLLQSKFASQEAGDPAVCEMRELYFLFFQMLSKLGILQTYDGTHFVDCEVYSGLKVGEIILHIVEQLRKAPEGISLSC